MSYILDALRKSDQQRQRGAAPTLLMGQVPAAAPKQPVYMYYGPLAAVLLGAGILIGWLQPWKAEPPATAVVAVKPAVVGPREEALVRTQSPPAPVLETQARNAPPPAPNAPAPAAPPARMPAAAPAPASTPAPVPAAAVAPAPVRVPAVAAAPAPAAAAVTAPPTAGARVEAPGKPQDTIAAVSKPAPAQQVPAPGAPAQAQKIIWLAELPLELQQELPPMTISVHAYSARAADRLLGVNNRMLHEGDYLAPGLKLEQITPEGMVFGYKGYSFRRGVK